MARVSSEPNLVIVFTEGATGTSGEDSIQSQLQEAGAVLARSWASPSLRFVEFHSSAEAIEKARTLHGTTVSGLKAEFADNRFGKAVRFGESKKTIFPEHILTISPAIR
jgi:hypothetical protein